MSNRAFAAEIYTDQSDYPPGATAIINGYGFTGGETVRFQVTFYSGGTPSAPSYNPWNVIADGLGDVETTWLVPEDALGETLLVTATGLTSGRVATTTFTDRTTELYITTSLGTICPGSTPQVCAELYEKCSGGSIVPLPSRPIIFYLTEGNCGVNVGEEGFDTVLTDVNGQACATLPSTSTPGNYALRVKFLGESKPGVGDPANSACDPGERVQLSASNDCQTFVIDPSACNEPPVATCHGDTTVFLCALGPVCIPGFSCTDPEGALQSCQVSLGTLSGGSVCFTPTGAGPHTIRLIATDAAGLADTCQTIVTIVLNQAPVCTLPSNAAYFVCGDSTFSFPVSATDADGNLTGCTKTSGPGTLTGGNWVFTTTGPGTYTANFTCTDACGASCSGTSSITVNYNQAPVATYPGNQSLAVCNLSPLTISGFSCSDANGNLTSCSVDKGTLTGNAVTFTPVAGANTITLTATDACGRIGTCQTTITVVLNQPPIVSCPGDQTIFRCNLSDMTLGGFSCSDPDGNLATCAVNVGTLSGSELTFEPVAGLNTIILTATDACGATATCQAKITIVENDMPWADMPDNDTLFLSTTQEFCYNITVGDPDYPQYQSLPQARLVRGAGSIANNVLCFTPVQGIDSIYWFIVEVCDSCGIPVGRPPASPLNTCVTDSFFVQVRYNQPPVAACHGDTTVFLCALGQVCIPGFSCTDPEGALQSCEVSLGTLSGGSVCFTPTASGQYTIQLIATDEGGLADTCQTIVTIVLNQAPVCNLPANATYRVCADSTFSFPVSATDPDGNLIGCTKTNGPGTLTGGNWVFTTTGPGTYVGNFTCTDACGASCSGTSTITVNYNQAPMATCPGNQTRLVCDLSPITVSGFSCSDADGNLTSCSVDKGTLTGNAVIFTPVSGVNTITLTATDACGRTNTCQTLVTVVLNQAPVCNLPANATYFVCTDSTFSFPVSATDIDGNLTGCTKTGGPGTLTGGNWVFTTTGPGTYVGNFTCTDACGASCSGTSTITVIYNHPPVCLVPNDTVIAQCSPEEVCLPVSATDEDGNLTGCQIISGPGALSGGEWCYTPTESQSVTVTIRCTDQCGAFCESSFSVDFISRPVVRIEKTEKTLQGHVAPVKVTIENAALFEIGGFNLLLGYDAAALTFFGAESGDLLTDCGWEYFVYRYGPDGNCGSACPSGMVRLIAMADINNGPHHPACYGPTDRGSHGLADLKFMVTNDRAFECQYVPIYFIWMNCGDNGFSNIDGDSLIVESRIFDFEEKILWDEFDEVQYPDEARPTFLGSRDTCLAGFKFAPYRCMDFQYGGIDIVCADSIDARGDINLNGVPNEVADAVLLTNYFVQGLEAFVHIEGSVAASDVNNDGIALSVADLVYLIRVIVGDAVPYAKVGPNASLEVSTMPTAEGLIVSYEASTTVGAMLLTFTSDGAVGEPILGPGAAGMDVVTGRSGNELRVLVYNIGPHGIAEGQHRLLTIPGQGRLTLTGVDAADYLGAVMPVSTHHLPTSFALDQNYPNPFNPTTTIALSLAVASDWTVSIYNISGQKVRQFSGYSEPGTITLTWDATDANGGELASGIYFYRATAGNATATRKMILMR